MFPELEVIKPNLTKITIKLMLPNNPELVFYFSYSTIIAYYLTGHGLLVDDNFYSNTTRTHQNYLVNEFGGVYDTHYNFQLRLYDLKYSTRPAN